jgi:hypothetical protein
MFATTRLTHRSAAPRVALGYGGAKVDTQVDRYGGGDGPFVEVRQSR